MNYLEKKRIKIENKNGKILLLDSLTHLAYNINETAYLIIKLLLAKKQEHEIIDSLIKNFTDLDKKSAPEELKEFLIFLEKRSFFDHSEKLIKQAIPPIQKITLAITSNCNFFCTHCLAANTLNSNQELSLNTIKRILSELDIKKIKSIALFGGEPFMHKDFFSILDYILDMNIQVSVNTNASLITEKIAKKLALRKSVSYTASLDGALEKTQNSMRGTGTYQETLKGIKNLVNEKLNTIISTTITKYNFKEVKLLVNLAKEIGVKQIRFNDVHFGGNASCFIEKIRLNAKEKWEVLNDIKEVYDNDPNFITGSLIDQYKIVHSLDNTSLHFPLIIPPCGASMGSICIKADGDITPCEILWDHTCGNIYKNSLSEIYYSTEMNQFRMPLVINKRDVSACNGCEYLQVCFKGHRCAPYFFPGETLCDKAKHSCLKMNLL